MLGLLIALQISGAAGAAAAAPIPPAAPEPACKVLNASKAPDRADLYVGCGRRAVGLGRADQYQSAYNPVLRSTLVIARSGQRTIVYLVAPTAGEAYHVDEISRDLAKASGRYIDAGLPADIALDLSGFATLGSVKVPTAPPSGPPTNSSVVDLTDYVARALTLAIPVSPLPDGPPPVRAATTKVTG